MRGGGEETYCEEQLEFVGMMSWVVVVVDKHERDKFNARRLKFI
jgi:hypothetical protein